MWLASARQWARGRAPRGAVVAAGGVVGLVVLSGGTVRTGGRVNLRGDDSAVAFVRTTLASLPPDATSDTARDDVTFALWYAQRALGLRRDVHVIDVRNPQLVGVP